MRTSTKITDDSEIFLFKVDKNNQVRPPLLLRGGMSQVQVSVKWNSIPVQWHHTHPNSRAEMNSQGTKTLTLTEYTLEWEVSNPAAMCIDYKKQKDGIYG